MNKHISKLFYLFLLISLTSYAEDIYQYIDPLTGYKTSSPTPPKYPIKSKRTVGVLPDGNLIELIIDTDNQQVKSIINDRQAREAQSNSSFFESGVADSYKGKNKAFELIETYGDNDHINKKCFEDSKVYQGDYRVRQKRGCVKQQRQEVSDLNEIINLIDNRAGNHNQIWQYEGSQINGPELRNKLINECASMNLSDEHQDFQGMKLCLRSAYQKLYSAINYK